LEPIAVTIIFIGTVHLFRGDQYILDPENRAFFYLTKLFLFIFLLGPTGPRQLQWLCVRMRAMTIVPSKTHDPPKKNLLELTLKLLSWIDMASM